MAITLEDVLKVRSKKRAEHNSRVTEAASALIQEIFKWFSENENLHSLVIVYEPTKNGKILLDRKETEIAYSDEVLDKMIDLVNGDCLCCQKVDDGKEPQAVRLTIND